MDSVASLSSVERGELFTQTAAIKGMTPAIIEKDFWVCWTLSRFFEHQQLSKLLVFKGGTSLSKVFNLIERFSEDIDLILDWRVVIGGEDPLLARSNTQQGKFNKVLVEQAGAYIGGELFQMISSALAPICTCELAADDLNVINVKYPAAFSDGYLRPEVRLEIGPLAAWTPSDSFRVQSYAAEAFPQIFKKGDCTVQAIRAERTFWEKITILHHEFHRPEGSPQPLRYSRHYYDLVMMSAAPIKDSALADFALFEDVISFKQRFYPRGWAKYDEAKLGSCKLVPSGHVLAAVKKDYAQMRNLIFGRYPPFDEMMTVLKTLENEINQTYEKRLKNSSPPNRGLPERNGLS
jgi:hypothetical protein